MSTPLLNHAALPDARTPRHLHSSARLFRFCCLLVLLTFPAFAEAGNLVSHFQSLTIGRKVRLAVTETSNLTWSSSDTTIATVHDGIVKGKRPGSAFVVATPTGGGIPDTCAVTVVPWIAGVTNLAMEPYLNEMTAQAIRNDTLYLKGTGNQFLYRSLYYYSEGMAGPELLADFLNDGTFGTENEPVLPTPFGVFVLAKRETANGPRKIYKILPQSNVTQQVYDQFPPNPISPNLSYTMQQGWDFDNQGNVYLGEYNAQSPQDYQIRIFKGSNFGEQWNNVYTYPPRSISGDEGGIRHVHACQVDPYDGTVWISTGDGDSQARIYIHRNKLLPDSSGNMQLELVGMGSQEFRIVSFAFTPNYIYWFMDAPCDTQKIFRVRRSDSYPVLTPATIPTGDYRELLGVLPDKPFYQNTVLREGSTHTILIETVYEDAPHYNCGFTELDTRTRVIAVREEGDGSVQVQEVFDSPSYRTFARALPVGTDSRGYVYFTASNILGLDTIKVLRSQVQWNESDDLITSPSDTAKDCPHTALRLSGTFTSADRLIVSRIHSTPAGGVLPPDVSVLGNEYWQLSLVNESLLNGMISIPLVELRGFAPGSSLVWLGRQNPGDDWTEIGGAVRNGRLESTVPFSSYTELAVGASRFTITSTSGMNGTITPSGSTLVHRGATQSFTITPNIGFAVDSVIVDGIRMDSVTGYTFTNVSFDHSIRVVFAISRYTITAQGGPHGTITPNGPAVISRGANAAFVISADTGYEVDSIIVDGVRVDSSSRYTFSNVTSDHSIRATFAPSQFTISIFPSENGAIVPGGVLGAPAYGIRSFGMIPAAGFHVDSIFVDGIDVGPESSYTFRDITADHTLRATFARNQSIILASAGPDGMITPAGSFTVFEGTSPRFVFSANPSYRVDSVFVDGRAVDSLSGYTFTGIVGNHTIHVTFVRIRHTIVSSSSSGGSITPAGTIIAEEGASQNFSFAASAGYFLDSLLVDGIAVDSPATYTFASITGNHLIRAVFAINRYMITASPALNGSLSPQGTITVSHGSNQTYTITPGPGYYVDSVIVDGLFAGRVQSYLFSNVTSSHTIRVAFALIPQSALNLGVRDNFNAPATLSINGRQRWVTLTNNETNGAIQINADSTISPYNSGLNQRGGVAWDSLFSDGARTGLVVRQKGRNGSNTTVFYIYFRMNGKNLTSSSGYCLLYFEQPSATDIVYLMRVSDPNTFTPLVRLNREISVGDTLVAKVETSKQMKVYVYGANGIRDSVSAVDNTYNPDQWYVWLRGVTLPTPVKLDNFMYGPVAGPTPTIGQLTIAASAGANGSITPSGSVAVGAGANQSFAILPAAHYVVDSVFIDGIPIPPVTDYTFTNVTADHSIRSTFALQQFTITATAGANGSVSPGGATAVSYGSSQTFTFTPDIGYHVDSVVVDGVSVGPLSSYTFSAVSAGHTLRVVFAPDVYALTASAGPNCIITPSGMVSSVHGSSQQFVISATAGYHIDSVIVDGARVDSLSSYTFTNIVSNHSIRAVAAVNRYPITVSTGPNGSLSPLGTVLVNHASNQTFFVTPDVGHHLDSLFADGVRVDSITRYTFISVTGPRTLRAVFAPDQFAITASAGSHGSITPSGTIIVQYGQYQSFTIAADEGYYVDSVIIDDAKADSTGRYTFISVSSPHTIRVTFKSVQHYVTTTATVGGSVFPDGVVGASYEETKTFSIIPNTGYHLDSLLVDNIRVDSTTTYTLYNIIDDHTLQAFFTINSYTLTSNAGSHGSIAPAGVLSLTHGEQQRYLMQADSGYHVDSVIVDGEKVDSTGSFTFTSLSASHTIRASFAINMYSILATAGAHGSISPSGPSQFLEGASQTYSIAPVEGYHVDSVVVDGINLGPISPYPFVNIQANHTINAYFSINRYPIVTTAEPHGAINPGGAILANHGSSVTFTVTPDTGYHIDSILVDGANTGTASPVVMNNITSNRTLRAFFSINRYVVSASAGARGSISPPSTTTLDHGSTLTYAIAPDSGYRIDSLIIDAVSVTPQPSYTFSNVTSSHTIRAAFAFVPAFAGELRLRDNFSVPPTTNISGRNKWLTLTSNEAGGSIQINSDSTISPFNTAINNRGGVAWDSLLTDGARIGLVVRQKGGSGNNITTFYIYFRMNGRNFLTSSGYCLLVFDRPTATDVVYLMRASNANTLTSIGSLPREIAVGDTLVVKVEADKRMKVCVYGANQVRDSVTAIDNTYNPTQWYCWIRGVVLQTPVKMDNFMIGPSFTSLPSGSRADGAGLASIPTGYALEQNYPNPFNPTTLIRYSLPVAGPVAVKVYDVLGQEVMTLVDGYEDAGYKLIAFDAGNLPSGVYYYRMVAGAFAETRKLMIVK